MGTFYHIIFTTIGYELRGNRRKRRENAAKNRPPVLLDDAMREVVLHTILVSAELRGWHITAANIQRTNLELLLTHLRLRAGQISSFFKQETTEALRTAQLLGPKEEVWSPGGAVRKIAIPTVELVEQSIISQHADVNFAIRNGHRTRQNPNSLDKFYA